MCSHLTSEAGMCWLLVHNMAPLWSLPVKGNSLGRPLLLNVSNIPLSMGGIAQSLGRRLL